MRGGLCHCRHSCQIQGTCPEPLHPCSLYPDSACLQMWLLGAELPSGSWWYMSDSFVTPWPLAHQAPLSMGFPGKNTGRIS